MNTIFAILTITIGYYFIIKSILNKESKDRIFYMTFITMLFLFVIIIVSFIDIFILTLLIFLIYILLVHGFYTDFIVFNEIYEYFLKRKKSKNNYEQSIKFSLLKIINKEVKEFKEEFINIFKLKSITFDILIITYGFILTITFILKITGVVDIFEIIKNL